MKIKYKYSLKRFFKKIKQHADMKYYSQYCQDFFIDILLKKKENGVFLDIGANDGVSFSNTYFFEKERNWTGLCVEPHIDIFEICKKKRSCNLENCCITDQERTVTFRKITGADMLSGIVEYMDKNALERIEDHIKEDGGSYVDVKIESCNINKLIDKYNINKIDFCSIDVEGAELEIVKSINFQKNDITSFAIEGNNEELIQFLKEKGYIAIPSENDIFYIKKGTKRIALLSLYVKTYVLDWKIWRHLPKWLKRKR